MDNFDNILVREATAINSKVEAHSARDAIERGNLSWSTVEDQTKEVVVRKLRTIEHLDEAQCIELFDKIHGMILIQPERKRRDYIFKIIRGFYARWIMKRMCHISDCFHF